MTSREIIFSYYMQKISLAPISVLIRKKIIGGKKPKKIHLTVANPWNKETGSDKKKSHELKEGAFANLYAVSLWRQHSACGALAHTFSWRTLHPSKVTDVGCGDSVAGF